VPTVFAATVMEPSVPAWKVSYQELLRAGINKIGLVVVLDELSLVVKMEMDFCSSLVSNCQTCLIPG
jgi:peroxiredoxin